MTCPFCKLGTTSPGRVTATLSRGRTTIVITGVPAEVCTSCREPYFDETTTSRMVELVHDASLRGVKREVRKYTTAS